MISLKSPGQSYGMKLPPSFSLGFVIGIVVPNTPQIFFSSLNVHESDGNAMHLHPKCCSVKCKLHQSLAFVIALHDNQVFVKAPWFSKDHLISFGLVVEYKEHCIIAHVLNLKTITGSPRRGKSLSDGVNIQNTFGEC